MIALLAAIVMINNADCPALPEPGAPTVTTSDRTQLVCHEGYASLFDLKAKIPLWVAYTLTKDHTLHSCAARDNDFHEDELLPAGASAVNDDYWKSGYDRGHQAPAEDFAWNPAEDHDSFSFANMAPQRPGLNRQGWERLEATVRAWALAYGPLSVYTGPVIAGEKTIGPDKVVVPRGFWKVIVSGQFDPVAIYMPNAPVKKGKLDKYQVPITKVEAMANIKFPITPLPGAKTPALPPADLDEWEAQRKATCK